MLRRPLLIGILVLAMTACGDDSGGGTPDAAPTPDADTRGTISFSWTLSDGSNAINCDDIGANAVSITMLPVGVLGSSTDIANCVSGTLVTGPVIPRDYNVEINLSATEGDLIDEPITFSNVTVTALQDTPLGAVEFVVDPVGNLSFKLAANATGGNCDTVVNDGAEIIGFELSLNQDSVCVPVTFTIADENGDPVTPAYMVTCTAGDTPYTPCLPETYTLSVADVGSGATTLDISGLRTGDEPCYVATADLDIPGNGLTTDVGAITIPLDLANPVCNPDATPDAAP